MRSTLATFLLPVGLALLLASRAPAADPTEPDAEGKRLLKKYGVTSDAAGLRAYFRALRPAESRKEAAALVVKLGSDDFDERETATRRLTLLVLVVQVELKQAAGNPDAEVSRRAAGALAALESDSVPLFRAALRSTAALRPEGLAAELLAVLPGLQHDYSKHRAVEETVWKISRPADAAAFRKALVDADPIVRSAALTALERLVGADAADDVRTGLKDRDALVRLAAVGALARQAPRESLGPLVDLLEAEEVSVRVDAAALLNAVTGKRLEYSAHDTPEGRKAGAARWRDWVKENGATAKLTPPPRDLRRAPSRLLLCQFEPFRVRELNLDGKVLFESKAADSACGCDALPDGRRFLADWAGGAVIELDPAGKVTRRLPVGGNLNSLELQPDGNLLVSVYQERKIVELKPDGTEAWRVNVEGTPTDAHRLEGGRTLVALFDKRLLVELDRDGKVLWKVEGVPSPESARRLASGNTLVASSGSAEVLEYDRAGKLVWSARDLSSAYDAVELSNGHILAAYALGLREIDRTGKVVREYPVGKVRRICLY
jgi:hypothetical protein